MPFEPYVREVVRTTEPKISISTFGRISLNRGATEFVTKTYSGGVVLFWDKATNRVGIQTAKKSDDKSRVYNLKAYGPKGKTGSGFSAVTFLNFIQYNWSKTRSFDVEWSATDNMLVFTIPAEYLTGYPQGSRREVQAKRKG